jgi:hypothetical protein
MEKRLRTTAIVLLIFNGISALWGGSGLIYDPQGEFMQMPLEMLRHSPFYTYLIPGIILLTMNGLLSITIAIMAISRYSYYPGLIILQGIILTGWLSVQIIMIRAFFAPLHVPYYLVGLGLIAIGYSLLKIRKSLAKN